MTKSSNQKKKPFLILKYLWEKSDENNFIPMSKIVEYLDSYGINSERKSIYSDMETLSELGFDIISNRQKGYCLASRDFQLAELKLLCDAVAASKFITPKKSGELIEKLKKLTSEDQAKSLRRQVAVANRIKTMNESIYYAIDDIHRAIAENRKISFCYFDFDENKQKILRHGGKRYTADPISLLWDDDNYYLIARDCEADKIKHYRADKISGLEILEEKADAEISKNFDISEYTSKLFGMFGGEEEAVWLSCKNSFAGKVIDRFGKDLSFVKEDEDTFKVRVKVIVSPQFFAWVFGMNEGIKIKGPEETVEKFVNYLKTAAKDYGIS